MFTFPIAKVREIYEKGKADAAANGGFLNPYYGLLKGEGEEPGIWLVGDHGVYLMANGKRPPGELPLIEYAAECNPHTDPTGFYEYKRDCFGGDDGVEYFPADWVEHYLEWANDTGGTRLAIWFEDEDIHAEVRA